MSVTKLFVLAAVVAVCYATVQNEQGLLRASGIACTGNTDCGDGMYCHFYRLTGVFTGECLPKPRRAHFLSANLYQFRCDEVLHRCKRGKKCIFGICV